MKYKPTTKTSLKDNKDELEKADRRLQIDAKTRSKRPDKYALCGKNYYSVSPHELEHGKYWRTCARCGKPLQYYSTYEEAQANRRECSMLK
ncbi:MAG: hypothetical protein NTZ16_15100 [Verrucomicrobia bacterium]|nr:hypothetical protein [Verrucomicrobiota bacterium]